MFLACLYEKKRESYCCHSDIDIGTGVGVGIGIILLKVFRQRFLFPRFEKVGGIQGSKFTLVRSYLRVVCR